MLIQYFYIKFYYSFPDVNKRSLSTQECHGFTVSSQKENAFVYNTLALLHLLYMNWSIPAVPIPATYMA